MPHTRLPPLSLLLAVAGRVAGDVLLRDARHGERVGRDVLGDRRAGADDRTVSDRDRRDELDVGADEDVLPDRRPVLREAVVVTRDDARADVRALADVR